MSWIRGSDRSHRLAAQLGVALATAVVAHSPPVAAQQPAPATDPAGAEVLFNDAKKAMASGDYESACPKLAESYRLDPGTGTLTALAVCHESQGKTATAWAEFIQVVSDATQAHRPDREKFARQHIAMLEPKLSKLTLTVDPAVQSLPGFEVRRDGVVVGRAAWGTAVPVDPADHTIEATADGKQRWSTTIKVRDGSDAQTVTVPPLEDAPATATGAPPASPSPSDEDRNASAKPADEAGSPRPSASPQRTIGLVVGAVGVAAAGLGTYFGVEALSKSSQANGLCPQSTCSNTKGVNDESSAKGSALGADIALGGAIVALAVGTVLFLTAPHQASTSTNARLVPLFFSSPIGARGLGTAGSGAAYSVKW
jgi:hypothetical protein